MSRFIFRSTPALLDAQIELEQPGFSCSVITLPSECALMNERMSKSYGHSKLGAAASSQQWFGELRAAMAARFCGCVFDPAPSPAPAPAAARAAPQGSRVVKVDSSRKSPVVFDEDWLGTAYLKDPTVCGANYAEQTRIIDNFFRYWWSTESMERAEAALARSKVGCFAPGTVKYILDKAISAMIRPNARVGTTRNDYAKNVPFYDFIITQIGMIDCTGASAGTCTAGEFLMALKNLAKRRFPKMKLFGALIAGGDDLLAKIRSIFLSLMRRIPRGLRRTFSKAWRSAGIDKVLGVQIYEGDRAFKRSLAELGGALVQTVQIANSCYGPTGTVLDPHEYIFALYTYVRSILMVEPQVNQLLISFPGQMEAPSRDQVILALEALLQAAPVTSGTIDRPRRQGEPEAEYLNDQCHGSPPPQVTACRAEVDGPFEGVEIPEEMGGSWAALKAQFASSISLLLHERSVEPFVAEPIRLFAGAAVGALSASAPPKPAHAVVMLRSLLGDEGMVYRWLMNGYESLMASSHPPAFSVHQVLRNPMLVGDDGAKQLAKALGGTPEHAMMHTVVLHAYMVGLSRSDHTVFDIAKACGDDSHENALCLERSSGILTRINDIFNHYSPDIFASDLAPFAMEVRAGYWTPPQMPQIHPSMRWLFSDPEWCLDGKARVNYACHGGWFDHFPCGNCMCPRDDILHQRYDPEQHALWSVKYRQAVIDAMAANEAGEPLDFSDGLDVLTIMALADLIALTHGFVEKEVHVHATLYTSDKVLPTSLALGAAAASAAKTAATAAEQANARSLCSRTHTELAPFAPTASPPGISTQRISPRAPISTLKASIERWLNVLLACADENKQPDAGLLRASMNAVNTSYIEATETHFYATKLEGTRRHSGGWTAIFKAYVARADVMVGLLTARSFDVTNPPSSIKSDRLELLCRFISSFIVTCRTELAHVTDDGDNGAEGDGAAEGSGGAEGDGAAEGGGGAEGGNGDDANCNEGEETHRHAAEEAWDALTAAHKAHAKTLGFTQPHWDADNWMRITEGWQQLELDENKLAAAQELGFSAATWKGGRGVTTVAWDSLGPDFIKAAKKLGFKKTAWNNDDWSRIRRSWDDLERTGGPVLAAARALGFDRAIWKGQSTNPSPDLEDRLQQLGTAAMTTLFKSEGTNLLVNWQKVYHEDLQGIKCSCLLGPSCHSIDDGFHVDIMRTALTAVIDRGYHVLTDALTLYGKELYTGASSYPGLRGHSSPRACGQAVMKAAKPRSIVTHTCPQIRGRGGTRLCLKQASAHVWTDALGHPEYVPPIWECLPPTHGYDELFEQLHFQLMFSMAVVSLSLYPAWEFGKENTCESLAKDLTLSSKEFAIALTKLVPVRRSPGGHEIGWHYQMAHQFLQHRIPSFLSRCNSIRATSWDSNEALEKGHSNVKITEASSGGHSSGAAAHVSKTENRATLGQKERVYTHMERFKSGALITAADGAIGRRVQAVAKGAWPRLVKKSRAMRYAMHRCRTLGKATVISYEEEKYGEYKDSDEDCRSKALAMGEVSSVVTDAPVPTDDEAREERRAEDHNEHDDEDSDARTAAEGEGEEAEADTDDTVQAQTEDEHDELETEDDLEMLIAAATARLHTESLTRTARRKLQSHLDQLTHRLRAAEERAEAAAAEAAQLAPVLAIVEPAARERQLGEAAGEGAGANAEISHDDAKAELHDKYNDDYRNARKAVLKALCKGYGVDPTTGKRMLYGGTRDELWARLEHADAATATGNGGDEIRTTYTVGDDIEVDYGGDLGWVKGQVVGVQEDGLYEVEHPQWDEGSRLQQDVEASDMRALE